jgi:hypothetical protein
VKAWAQEFTEKGIYVFADSKEASKLTVVAVKSAEESCKDPDAPVQSMTAASLSAVGVESQAKSVQPNWAFIIGTFVVLLGFNFGVVGAFVYLHARNAAQMKLASGGGEAADIYRDKAKQQEGTGCCARICGKSRTTESAGEKGAKGKADGPRYADLARLLEDFRRQYTVLKDQLEEDRDRPAGGSGEDDPDGDERRQQEGLIEERIGALRELKDFVKEN